MQAQATTIRDIERVLPTKCNKSELNAGLMLKANKASDPIFDALCAPTVVVDGDGTQRTLLNQSLLTMLQAIARSDGQSGLE